MSKTIKITNETLILLNKAKSKILKQNPTLNKITDDQTVNKALQQYTENTK